MQEKRDRERNREERGKKIIEREKEKREDK
jgi:hypothetical protein